MIPTPPPIDAILSNMLITIITEGYKLIGGNTLQMISIVYDNRSYLVNVSLTIRIRSNIFFLTLVFLLML